MTDAEPLVDTLETHIENTRRAECRSCRILDALELSQPGINS